MHWTDELERRATPGLPDHVAAYVRGEAGDGACRREGLEEWARARLRPSVLHDTTTVDPRVEVLGTALDTPVLVAPMAQQVAADPAGEAATGRAAAAAGTLLGVSTNTAVPFAEIAAAGAPWWYQVYVMRDRDLTRRLVRRAVAAGARALLLTVDTTALAPALPGIEPPEWPDGPGRARLAGLTDAEKAAAGPAAMASAEDLTPDVVGWLREVGGVPVAVKGVLSGRDARRCVDAGAAAVVVSTHGGRRLGVSVGSLRALPEVVAAVGGDAEVHVDSGIRSGAAVVTALALGARAVWVGRPVWWALAAGGEAAVGDVLARLRAEVVATLRQLGVARVGDLRPDDVVLSWT